MIIFPPPRCWLAVLALTLMLPVPAIATDGETYLRLGAGYAQLNGAADRQGAQAGLGFGYSISDFSLVDLGLSYAALPGDDSWLNAGAGTAAFRLLIDATEWVPSIGVAVGWMAFLTAEDGLDEGTMFYGPQVCVEYRSSRDNSIQTCATAATFPLESDPDAFLGATIDVAAYLPW